MTEELEEYPREPLDTDTIFAKFTRQTLSEFEVMALSRATIVCNPSVPASEIYLTYVSACDCYIEEIRQFCLGVARQLAVSRKETKRGTYPYMPSYNETWGKHAISDAMVIAFLGKEHAPKVEGEGGRELMLGVSRPTYNKLRDFIAGVLTLCIMDYREALEWAMGKRRDTELQARWGRVTGQSFPAAKSHDTLRLDSQGNNPLPNGCYVKRMISVDSSESSYSYPPQMNAGLNDDELWRP